MNELNYNIWQEFKNGNTYFWLRHMKRSHLKGSEQNYFFLHFNSMGSNIF